ncbi:MAG: amino acid adenylation domain-containing protein [Verrucomicrobia bacterium]|nr:amino acid adenylation domain-containing protein [Verrucomicrobiota bacterium]
MQTREERRTDLSEARHLLLQEYLRGTAVSRRIPKRASSGPVPLSYSQQQIWLHSQLALDQPIYNEPITIHRHGDLNISALEKSFAEIVRRHEAWRTTFHWNGREAVQTVNPAPERIEIPLTDLRQKDEAEALQLATQDARAAFDVARGPLYRLRLVRFGESEYRLFLTLHHIIFDGVSLYRVLLPELLRLYDIFSRNEEPLAVELPIQYPDFAAWQRRSIKAIAPEHLDYWRRELSDMPVLDLPTDRPRPPTQTFAGAMEVFSVPASTALALKTLCQRQSTTPFLLMTAAFITLLHEYTRQQDVVVGAISSGRNYPEIANLLGCFLNTLPVRCRFSPGETFTDLLARVRKTTLSALAHEVPFELLVQKFGHERDPARAPLFQALIVMEPPLEPLPPEWDFTHTDVDTGTAKFDLQLDLDDRAEGLTGRFVYNTDLFERETIVALKERWLGLLEQIALSPEARIEQLTGASLPQRNWEINRSEYPRDATVHELFEEQAQLTPDAVALVLNQTQLSYGELNARADRLASKLREFGVAPDIPVAMWMERSLEMIVALLAVLKAGGAYLPLDPSYPVNRLRWMIADSGARLVITSKRLRAQIEPAEVPVLCIDDVGECHTAAAKSAARADDLAYIMYTSGSTGTPKGVAVPHRAIVRLVRNTDYASFSPSETFLQLAPISFDASTFEIWGALLNGARLGLMDSAMPSLEEIGRAVVNGGVTTLWLTSALFNAMVDERIAELRSLRQLLTGGDVLSPTHVAKALAALPGTRLINGYGPTESTTFACCHTITGGETGAIPIGKPIANTSVYILDENLRRVPIGAAGELCIGGDGLARGYWKRDELTREKFITDPFGNEPGARLYRAGDLARWRSDGVIEFLGRRDNQVKLRGFRIEPAEIEGALRRQHGVRDAAVLTRETPAGEKQLVAYVARDDASADGGGSLPGQSTRLLEALRAVLPEYMIPSAIVFLDELPRTANGKLDRAALPVPEMAGSAREFVPPRTEMEKTIADVWADVLERERVGRSDNFFDLGGHSLAAMRVAARLSETLGRDIEPSTLFRAQTVAAVADALEPSSGNAPAGESIRPYLSLQLELIAIWQDLLGKKIIGIHDNFFVLGGNAHAATQMLKRAALIAGETLTVSAFAAEPTIEALAAALTRRAGERTAAVIPLNNSGTRTPFFYLHGDLFGGGFYSAKLARALGPDQPFYGLPPLDVRKLQRAPTIEEMATTHLEVIRTARPRGPYIIGGFCLAGIVAYELAQQLAAQNEEVQMLMLIDVAPGDKVIRRLRKLTERVGERFGWDENKRLAQFARWAVRHAQFAIWRDEILREQARLAVKHLRKRVLARWKELRTNDRRKDVADARAGRDVPASFLWAAAEYSPQPYAAPAALLLSEDLLKRSQHLAEDWQRLASRLTVHQVKGSHLECITAHVNDLAATMEQCLRGVFPK